MILLRHAFFAAALALAGAPASTGWAADSPPRTIAMATPAPDWDSPRRVVLQVSDSADALDRAMTNAINIQAFYGADLVKIELVTIGPGVRALLTESATSADRVSSLQSYGIEFVACGNTLDTIGKAEADLLPGVRTVVAGYGELIERSLEGWVILKP